jgi:hypothetical protein
MRHITFSQRLLLGICLALPFGLVVTPLAQAAWSSGGSGSASSLAYTMPAGGQPATRVSGTSVTVRWPAALFPDNQSVAGYVVRRFDATTGTPATVAAGCSGTVATTTCTELNVPTGTWTYTDAPVQDNWTGAESAPSTPVTVP